MSDLDDMIELFSEYTVGDEEGDDITTAQLTLLESATLSQAQALNGGRFTGLDFARLHGYVILDKWVRKHGKGRIQEETVKENTWKVGAIKTTSAFMEDALQMIADFDNNIYTSADVGQAAIRNDAAIERLADDWYITKERSEL